MFLMILIERATELGWWHFTAAIVLDIGAGFVVAVVVVVVVTLVVTVTAGMAMKHPTDSLTERHVECREGEE